MAGWKGRLEREKEREKSKMSVKKEERRVKGTE